MGDNVIDLGFIVEISDEEIEEQADKIVKVCNAAIEKGVKFNIADESKSDLISKLQKLNDKMVQGFKKIPTENYQEQIEQLTQIQTLRKSLKELGESEDLFSGVKVDGKEINKIEQFQNAIKNLEDAFASLQKLKGAQSMFPQEMTGKAIQASMKNLKKNISDSLNAYSKESSKELDESTLKDMVALQAVKQRYDIKNDKFRDIKANNAKINKFDFTKDLELKDMSKEIQDKIQAQYQKAVQNIDVSVLRTIANEKITDAFKTFELVPEEAVDDAGDKSEKSIERQKKKLEEKIKDLSVKFIGNDGYKFDPTKDTSEDLQKLKDSLKQYSDLVGEVSKENFLDIINKGENTEISPSDLNYDEWFKIKPDELNGSVDQLGKQIQDIFKASGKDNTAFTAHWQDVGEILQKDVDICDQFKKALNGINDYNGINKVLKAVENYSFVLQDSENTIPPEELRNNLLNDLTALTPPDTDKNKDNKNSSQTDSSYASELQDVEELQKAVDKLKEKIDEKTKAIKSEATAMTEASSTEVAELEKITEAVKTLQKAIQDVGKINVHTPSADTSQNAPEKISGTPMNTEPSPTPQNKIDNITVNAEKIKNAISSAINQGSYVIENIAVNQDKLASIKQNIDNAFGSIKVNADTTEAETKLQGLSEKFKTIPITVDAASASAVIENLKVAPKYNINIAVSQESLTGIKSAIQEVLNSQPAIKLTNIDTSGAVISNLVLNEEIVAELKNKIQSQIGNIQIDITIPKIESFADILNKDIEAVKSLQSSYSNLSNTVRNYAQAQKQYAGKSSEEIKRNIQNIETLQKNCGSVKAAVDALSNSLTANMTNVVSEMSKLADQNVKLKEIKDTIETLSSVIHSLTFPISDSSLDSVNSSLKRTETMFKKVVEQLNSFKNIDSGALDVIKNWEVYISRLADKITALYSGIKSVISVTTASPKTVPASTPSATSKPQAAEDNKQVRQANSKTEQAQIQTSEAAKQTAEAKQQTEQAKAKTAEAQKQTQEAQKQSAAKSKQNKSDNQKYSETTLKELNKLFASGDRANLSDNFTQQLKTKQSEIETLVKQIGTEQNAYTQENIDKIAAMKKAYVDMLAVFIKASPDSNSAFGFDPTKMTAEFDKLSGKLQFKHITSLNGKIAQLKQEISDLIPSISKAGSMGEQDLKDLQTKIIGITTQFTNLRDTARESLSNDTSISSINKLNARFDDLIAKMQRYYAQNTKIQRDHNIDSQFRSMVSSAQTMERSTANLNQLNSQYQMLRNTIESKGLTGRSIGDELKYIAEKIGLKAILGNQVYRVIGYFKQMVTVVKQIDTGMTSLKRVSEETAESYKKFLQSAKGDARELGSELNSVVDATSSFARLGYNLQESSKLAQNAIMYKNVGWLDIETATNDLVSTMKTFNITAEDSIKIVDTFDTLGNKFALTSADVGSGLKTSASALAAANNTMEQSAAMITAITEITQDSSNAGNALKVLAMRLRGASAELQEEGEDVEGLCDSTSKLRDKLQSLAGVDIMLDENTFKSTYQIMSEIAHEWNNISDVNQAALLETIAGKTRANQVAALLNNWSQAEKALENSLNSAGTAAKENEVYLDSIEGKIAQLKATAQGLSNDIINSSWIKGFIDTINTILTGLDSVTEGLEKFSENFDKKTNVSKYFDTWKSVPSILTAVTAALTAMKKEVGMKMPFTPATEFMHKPENCWEALMPVYQSAA